MAEICASHNDIVDFPSAGTVEVVPMTFGGLSTSDNKRDVDKLRIASAATDVGCLSR